MEDAGLNKLGIMHPQPEYPLKESIRALVAVTRGKEFIRGRYLSETILFTPWMSQREIDTRMIKLEKPDSQWPTNKAHMFCQIFVSDKVCRDESIFEINGKEHLFRPEKESA